MKKRIFILPLFLLTLTIILTGCKEKVNTKNIYVSEYNNLMKAVDDLSSHKILQKFKKNIREYRLIHITKIMMEFILKPQTKILG